MLPEITPERGYVAHLWHIKKPESAGRGSSGTCPTHVFAGQAPEIPPGPFGGKGLWHIYGTRPNEVDETPQRR